MKQKNASVEMEMPHTEKSQDQINGNTSISEKKQEKGDGIKPVQEKPQASIDDSSSVPKKANRHIDDNDNLSEQAKAEYNELNDELSKTLADKEKYHDDGLHLKESTAAFELQMLDPSIFADPRGLEADTTFKNTNLPPEDSKSSDNLSSDWKNAADENWEDEFYNIPDSYVDDEDPTVLTDEAGSIASLLYVDEDNEYAPEHSMNDSVSFAQLREDMQKLKAEAKELHENEDEKAISDTTEEISGQLEFVIEDSEDDVQLCADQEENDTKLNVENEEPNTEYDDVAENAELYDDDTKDITEDNENSSTEVEEKSGKEQITTLIEEKKDAPREHIVTIDRKRISKKEEKQERAIDSAHEVISIFVFTLMAMLLVTAFLFRHTVVEGNSMNDTLHDGDYLIISNLFYTLNRGDIVVCDETGIEDHDSYGIDAPIVKRIIALGGDKVRIENGIIYVNGEILDESKYINDISEQAMSEITVPEGKIFVMGDNRRNSCDSEEFGCVDEDAIIGRVIFRFYPFDSIDFFN